MNVISTERVPIKVWTPVEEVEESALAQLKNTANLPCVFKHVAVMPDVHYGIGATVGSVVATKGAVIPAAVGVDIGCGMMAAKMPFTASDLPESLARLRADIEQAIPVGFGEHSSALPGALQWAGLQDFYQLPLALTPEKGKAERQLGTLGGGNHFIEICLDTDDTVWIMLHSGSRGVGNKIGNYYIDKAKRLMDTWQIQLHDPNLAYLAEGCREFGEYWRDLQWAQAYAMKNRELMMDRMITILTRALAPHAYEPITPDWTVNCHHNYAEREHHYGENIIVTRKGAIRARTGDFGIIPGSMGACSFIVRGRGNPESFCSCSHGAGRRLSRSAAGKQYTTDDLVAQTAGVECRKDAGVLDEIPGAYKDIDQVMKNQEDLVKIVATLKQVLCVKG